MLAIAATGIRHVGRRRRWTHDRDVADAQKKNQWAVKDSNLRPWD
jgi:hypothetical protein